jgi:HAD superfamily hydrolase (TIGR01549 family)
MDGPSALLLDFGGTLAIESPPRARIYADAAARRGLVVTEAEMAAQMGAAHEALPRRVEGAFRYSRPWFERFIEVIFVERLGLSSDDLAGVQDELFDRFADARTFVVFPGARELLARARDRAVPVALVSNWSFALEDLVRGLGLRFDAILCSAVEEVEKPEAAIFERALDRLGARAGDALHVGDSIRNDVEGARAVGLAAALVDRDGRHPEFAGTRIASLDALLPRARLLSRRGSTRPSPGTGSPG